MGALRTIHRWSGGVIGLVLAVLGLTGAILVWKDQWVSLPDQPAAATLALPDLVERIVEREQVQPRFILFSSDDFPVHRASFGDDAGAYFALDGGQLDRWTSVWERPELWLFDLHHHLLAGDLGETFAGLLALAGLGFVVTGVVLWWPTRRLFQLRPWPVRLGRSAIIRQHRDLGIVVAPLLALSCLTGAMLTLRPVAQALLSPFSSAEEIKRGQAAPTAPGGTLPDDADWVGLFATASSQFPGAQPRLVSLPAERGGLIALRMKQPGEWLPNGRTTLWFDPADMRLIEARDAFSLPRGLQLFNAVYPLHAAKVGGWLMKAVLTLSGLALAMLGTLATWSFWFRPGRTSAATA
jgi:uncharacterized iron-regulated membrane protein